MNSKSRPIAETDFRIKVRCLIKDLQSFKVKETRDRNLYLYTEDDMLMAWARKGTKQMKEFAVGTSIFGNMSFNQGLVIVTMVKQSVRGYLNKTRKLDKITSEYTANGKNQEAFAKLNEKEMFYSVDLNHAYWQILHKLGYIDDVTYKTFKDQEEYKKAFHLSCSLMVSRATIYHYKLGRLYKTTTTEEEDKEFKIIYDNVVHTLRNVLGEIYNKLGNDAIAYITDEILIRREALPVVKEYFKKMGYEFKITVCNKLNNSEYIKANSKTYKMFGKNSLTTREHKPEEIPHASRAVQFKAVMKRRKEMAL